jgi:hypothetical protein
LHPANPWPHRPDFDRITELTKRLEELCREGQALRDKIASIAGKQPVLPDRRVAGRAFTEPT